MADIRKEKVSCAVLVKKVHDLYNPSEDTEQVRIFMAGFWCGQAEKVYLGSCRAAMFRPPFDRHPWALDMISEITATYSLAYMVVATLYGDEIWIMRPQNKEEVQRMLQYVEDGPEWHAHRARLCGIPDEEIDPEFHLRRGRAVYVG